MSHSRCRRIIRNVHSTMLNKAYEKTGLPSVRMYKGAKATRGHKGSRSTFVKFTPVGSPGVTVTICIRGKKFNTMCNMPVKQLVVRGCLGKGLSPRSRIVTARVRGEEVSCKVRRE